jgi:hypothetical protein
MSEERKYTSLNAIQVKSGRETISTEEKLDVIGRLGKVNGLLTHAVMFDSLLVDNIQFVIMLIK